MFPPSERRVSAGAVLAVAVAAAIVLASALVPIPGSSPRSVVVLPMASAIPGTAVASSSPPSQSSTAATPAPATVVPPWWFNMSASGRGPRPEASDSASAAYDPVDGVTVLFGGCQSLICPSNETWLFSHGQWINVTNPTDAPPARYGASMDFDVNMQGILLFGGYGVAGFLGDTWLYSGGRWTDLSWVSTGPAPRRDASMAFDPQPEENGSVLFGGQLASGLTTNDTWVWESWSGWVPLATSLAPAPVDSAGFAYSPFDGYALLYGGFEVCGIFCFGVVDQTWELYAGEWWPVHPTGPTPGARGGAAMGFYTLYSEIVLFSGVNASFGLPDDTWGYRAGSWSQLSPGVPPPARFDAAFASGVSGTASLLFGGIGPSSDFNDTWIFESVPEVGVTVLSPVEASATTTFYLFVWGGSPPIDVEVDFGDGTSGSISTSGGSLTIAHTYEAPGTVLLFANLTDAVGVTYGTAVPDITVIAGPAVSIHTPIPGVDVGVPVHLSALAASSGTPPVNLSWTFGDGSTAKDANVSHAYSGAGTYTATVTATDSVGGRATASAPVRVASLPSVKAEAAPTSAAVNGSVNLFANVTGGTGPFSYAWTFGDGGVSGSPYPIHAFSHTGTYAVNVWVNDSGGGSAHATVQVEVGSANVGGAAGTPTWFWGALAALIAVGAVGAVLVVASLRRPKKPGASPPKYPEDDL